MGAVALCSLLLSVLAGLVTGILHAADGATPAAAVRAGGRAALQVLGVQAAVVAAIGAVLAAGGGP